MNDLGRRASSARPTEQADKPLAEFWYAIQPQGNGIIRFNEFHLARIIQCAATARNTSGGRIHPNSCRKDLVADRRFRRVTDGIEAL